MRTCLALLALFVIADISHAQPPVPAAKPVALAVVPTDSFAFLSVNVGKLWDNPGAKPLRDWFLAQKIGPTDELIGLSAAEVERITLVVPSAAKDSAPILLITTKKAYNEAKVLKALNAVRDDRGLPASNAVRLDNSAFPAVVLIDDRTLMFLTEFRGDLALAGIIGQLIAKKTDGPLAAALADAEKHDIAFAIDARPLAALMRADREKELAPYLTLFKAHTATFVADFDKSARGTLTLAFADAETAKRAAPVLKEGIAEFADTLGKELARRKERVDPTEGALIEAFILVLKAAKVNADGANVLATADLPYADVVTKIAAALPKSYAAAANSTRGQNNLKQLALAMHNYEAAMQVFPSDVYPAAGNKLLPWSWRVQVLPYIEQVQLFNQLDFMKAWDDPANLKKLEAMEMPKVFEIPGRPAPKGHTYFRVFSLPKNAKGTDRPWLIEGQRGPKVASITDGLSNTFMIVEAGEAVPWYKPDVLAYDGKLPLPQLGEKGADRFIVAMGDGSVRVFKPSKLGEQTLRALITPQGGETIDIP